MPKRIGIRVEKRRLGKLDAALAEIVAGMEAQLISSPLELRTIEQRTIDAAIAIGHART